MALSFVVVFRYMPKPTVSSLKKKLWKLFARYVKERDKFKCVTCGQKVEGRNAQAGHYLPKSACNLEYYFHERNVHCQCAGCNLFLHGNAPAYRKFIVRQYGKKTLDDLENNYRRTFNGDAHMWLLDKIDEYQNLTTK